MRKSEPMKVVVIIALILFLVSCAPNKQELQEQAATATSGFVHEARNVCDGVPMIGVSRYDPGPDIPKPLVYVQDGDVPIDSTVRVLNKLPVKWLALDRADLQVVVCLYSSKELVDTCSYQGGKVVRLYKINLKVVVHEAATGSEVGSFTVPGGNPGCTSSVSENSPNVSDGFGDFPSVPSIVNGMRGLGFNIRD